MVRKRVQTRIIGSTPPPLPPTNQMRHVPRARAETRVLSRTAICVFRNIKRPKITLEHLLLRVNRTIVKSITREIINEIVHGPKPPYVARFSYQKFLLNLYVNRYLDFNSQMKFPILYIIHLVAFSGPRRISAREILMLSFKTGR